MKRIFGFCIVLLFVCVALHGVAQAADRVEPTFADIAYGPHERNVLDFWQAPSDTPTPVIVRIHGGGFVHGSKDGFGRKDGNDIRRPGSH